MVIIYSQRSCRMPWLVGIDDIMRLYADRRLDWVSQRKT